MAEAAAVGDGFCADGTTIHTDIDCLRRDLGRIGLSLAEAGLKPDLSGLLPAEATEEWLYTRAAGPNVTCPPRDLRVQCGGTSESSNYTETEPIGIMVHEMRTSTVTPSN